MSNAPGSGRRLVAGGFVLLALWTGSGSGCRCGGPPTAEAGGERFLRCALLGPSGGSAREVRLGALAASRTGFALHIRDRGDGAFRVGALAGLQESADDNRANLRAIVDAFRAARLDAVVVAGGVGRDETTVAHLLRDLAPVGVPILAIVGSEESLAAYRDGVELAAGGSSGGVPVPVVDMTDVREVDFADGRVVSLPGASNPHSLEARDDGCAFLPADARALVPVLREGANRTPTVLLAAVPPRGHRPGNVDFARGGVNAGDPSVAGLLGDGDVRFGVFGHVYEAGPTGTRRDGSPVPEASWAPDLLVNPGAAEAIPTLHPDGTGSVGTAVIVEIEPTGGSGGSPRARYRVWRAGGELVLQSAP